MGILPVNIKRELIENGVVDIQISRKQQGKLHIKKY
jgi:hypothetical protein